MRNIFISLLILYSLALSSDTTLKSIDTNKYSILLPNITNLNRNRYNNTTPSSNINKYDYYSILFIITTNTKNSISQYAYSRSLCLIVFLIIIFIIILNYLSNLQKSKSKTIKDPRDTSNEDVYFSNYNILKKNLPFKGVEWKEFEDGIKSIINFNLLDNDLLFSHLTTTITNNSSANKIKSKRLKLLLLTQVFWINLILKNIFSNYPVVICSHTYC